MSVLIQDYPSCHYITFTLMQTQLPSSTVRRNDDRPVLEGNDRRGLIALGFSLAILFGVVSTPVFIYYYYVPQNQEVSTLCFSSKMYSHESNQNRNCRGSGIHDSFTSFEPYCVIFSFSFSLTSKLLYLDQLKLFLRHC